MSLTDYVFRQKTGVSIKVFKLSIQTDTKISWVIPTNMKRMCSLVYFQHLNLILCSFVKVLRVLEIKTTIFDVLLCW